MGPLGIQVNVGATFKGLVPFEQHDFIGYTPPDLLVPLSRLQYLAIKATQLTSPVAAALQACESMMESINLTKAQK